MKEIKTLQISYLAVVVVVVVAAGVPFLAVMAAVPRPLSSWTTAMPHSRRYIAVPSMATFPGSSRLAFVSTTSTIRGGSSPVYDEDEEADVQEEDEAEMLMDVVDGDDDEDDDEEEFEEDEIDEEAEEEWETLEELEEDILAVEVGALEEEEDLFSALEEDEAGDDIVDEVLDEVDDVAINMDEEEEGSPAFAGATTTDGELADDEGEATDNISSPEDMFAVTAGGASLVMEEEEEAEDDDAAVAEVDVVEITEISEEMKQVLWKELEYTKREIKLMRPDVAAMVVYNRLIRPGEGMPPNFYVEGAGPPSFLQENLPKICVGIALATVTGFAYGRIKEGDVDLSEVTDAFKAIPKAFVAASVAIKGKVVAVFPSKKKTVSMPGNIMLMPGEVVDVEVVEETIGGSKKDEEKDNTVHSLKPGTKEGPKLDEDESTLDKFLTKIEQAIKAFFRITI